MAKKNKQTSYWPHMILGFLLVGITLGYWTVKSATSVPVQETKKKRFDKKYTIVIDGVKKGIFELEHVKRAKEEKVILLKKGPNTFTYRVLDKSGKPVEGVKVTFMLTRPHTDRDNVVVNNIPLKNGEYIVADINISKPGRYILRLKAVADKDTVGYMDAPAYLNP